MSSPTKHKRKSLTEAFNDGLNLTESSISSQHPSSSSAPSRPFDLVTSLRKAFIKSYPPSGSFRGQPIVPGFTIKMDDAYDYFHFDEDPDELFKETIGIHDEVKKMLESLTPDSEAAIDAFYLKCLSKFIFGSNLIERAGAGVDVTYKLCQLVFTGNDGDIDEEQLVRSEEYDQIRRDLVARGIPDSKSVVYRSRQEIIQHARALRHIINVMVVQDQPLTEKVILDTHKILCHRVDSPDGCHFTTYAGKYRTESVVAGFTSFTPFEGIPREMARLVEEFNRDIARAVTLGELDPYVLAAKMCHKFVNIHPFIDGNGRICRLILNAVLVKYAGVLVCLGEKEQDRDEYLTIAINASEAQSRGDWCDEEGEDNKYWKGLATLTLRHAKDQVRALLSKIKGVHRSQDS